MWHSGNRSLGRKQQRVRALSRGVWRLWLILGASLALASGAVAWFSISEEAKATASDNLPEIALQAKDDFGYDLAQLEPAQTRFFTYQNSSEQSRLLVQRDAKGVIRTAFASCTACYSNRREHKLIRGSLICGRCGSAMRIGNQDEHITPDKSCVAVPVPFSIEQNKVIVRRQAITDGLKIFAAANSDAVQKKVSLETR